MFVHRSSMRPSNAVLLYTIHVCQYFNISSESVGLIHFLNPGQIEQKCWKDPVGQSITLVTLHFIEIKIKKQKVKKLSTYIKDFNKAHVLWRKKHGQHRHRSRLLINYTDQSFHSFQSRAGDRTSSSSDRPNKCYYWLTFNGKSGPKALNIQRKTSRKWS